MAEHIVQDDRKINSPKVPPKANAKPVNEETMVTMGQIMLGIFQGPKGSPTILRLPSGIKWKDRPGA
jgi:hypothetical protein